MLYAFAASGHPVRVFIHCIVKYDDNPYPIDFPIYCITINMYY